ncbi:hypothetical protein FHG87_014993, partial [Trinorchestia longiramus]
GKSFLLEWDRSVTRDLVIIMKKHVLSIGRGAVTKKCCQWM